MQKPVLVDELNPLQHLNGEHEDGFERKLSTAVFEQVLQTRSEQVYCHHIIITFLPKVMDLRQSNYKIKKRTYISKSEQKKYENAFNTSYLPAPLNILYSLAS